jgi:hypothetical protein
MNGMTKDEVRDRLGNIDQIRDIIFGAQSREYNERLERIESSLARMQQDTRDRIEQLKSHCDAELKAAVELIEKRMKSVQTANQEECLEIRQQAERLNKRFSTTIQTLDEAIDRQFSSMQNELVDTKSGLQEDIGALRDLVLEELERRLSQMQDVKVSKDDIAETLFELGMRLKGAEFIPALRDAGSKSEAAADPLPLLATRKHAEEVAPLH